MPDSIFNESMRQGINVLFVSLLFFFNFFFLLFCFVFLRGETSVYLRMKEMESVLVL